jgi:hypothetical protein
MTAERDEEFRRAVMERQAEESIEFNTPWLKMRGNGALGVIMMITGLLVAAIFYVGWQMQEEHRMIAHTQKEVIGGMNDLFLAIMMPPEAKNNLPPLLKSRIKDKAEEKAASKVGVGEH